MSLPVAAAGLGLLVVGALGVLVLGDARGPLAAPLGLGLVLVVAGLLVGVVDLSAARVYPLTTAIAVFAGFVPQGDATIKPIAFALAVGVLVDALVVRMVLVPAALSLLGRSAWWLPRWLDRAMPDVDIEGEKLRPAGGSGGHEDAERPAVQTAP